MKAHVVKKLKEPRYLMIFIGSALVFFDVNYWLMSTLPGSRNEMCVMGVNLTPGNIAFSVILSILTGIMIAGIIAVLARRAAERMIARKVALTSLSGVGLGVGLLTVFCPVCAIPLFSMFGLSVVFQMFNDYNIVFKVASLLFVAVSLFLLNGQLSEECTKCAFAPEPEAE